MSHIYFKKEVSKGHGVLKVINDAGIELSLQGDDSCGDLPECSRLTSAFFHSSTSGGMISKEILGPSAEDFLQMLAKHLGYISEKIH